MKEDARRAVMRAAHQRRDSRDRKLGRATGLASSPFRAHSATNSGPPIDHLGPWDSRSKRTDSGRAPGRTNWHEKKTA